MTAPKATEKPPSPGGLSRKEIAAPPIPTSSVSEENAESALRNYEQAQLHLFQSNFNLILQQVQSWVAVQKQMQVEMELTLGKVRAFAELAERIVQTSDSQLEKLVAVTAALLQLMDQLQNPPQQ